jgi:hypothetical protein
MHQGGIELVQLSKLPMFDWFKRRSEGSDGHRDGGRRRDEKPAFRPAKLPPRRSEQPEPQELRLKIEVPTNWAAQHIPNAPATFCRRASTNAFQVSWAEYRGGKPLPEITADSLKGMATTFGEKNRFGEIVESSGGKCRFGSFGTAVFRTTEHPRIQVWFISDGREHIMATHVCDCEPEPSEVTEVQQIARSLALGP